MPLLEFAASQAFFELSESFLHRLASKELGIALEGALAEQILQLVRHILQCDDDRACGILETRVKHLENSSRPFDELAQTHECAERIDESDEGTFKAHLQQVEQKQASLNDLKEHITRMLQACKPKSGKRRKCVQTDLPDRDDKYTYDGVFRFFLVTIQVKLRKDYFNGRWQVWWRRSFAAPWRSLSRSWGTRSHEECLLDLLRATWTVAEASGEQCPILGLLS